MNPSLKIKINKTICKFESQHTKWVKDKIGEVNLTKKDGKDRFSPFFIIGDKDEKEIKFKVYRAIKNTELVRHAVEKMGWEFHKPQWIKEWEEFIEKCKAVFEACEKGDEFLDKSGLKKF